MSRTTFTRADLAEAVCKNVGLSRTESTRLVESVLETIAERLEVEHSVKLSSFGTFAVRQKKERIGRNPKTGEEVPIEPRHVLNFKPSHVLKDKVNTSLHKKAAL